MYKYFPGVEAIDLRKNSSGRRRYNLLSSLRALFYNCSQEPVNGGDCQPCQFRQHVEVSHAPLDDRRCILYEMFAERGMGRRAINLLEQTCGMFDGSGCTYDPARRAEELRERRRLEEEKRIEAQISGTQNGKEPPIYEHWR